VDASANLLSGAHQRSTKTSREDRRKSNLGNEQTNTSGTDHREKIHVAKGRSWEKGLGKLNPRKRDQSKGVTYLGRHFPVYALRRKEPPKEGYCEEGGLKERELNFFSKLKTGRCVVSRLWKGGAAGEDSPCETGSLAARGGARDGGKG